MRWLHAVGRGIRQLIGAGVWLVRAIWFDVVGLAGLVVLDWGLWQVSEPLTFVVTGILLMGYALAGARATVNREGE